MSLRSAVESLYDCLATVTVRVPVREGAFTRFEERQTVTDAPCRVSFSGAGRQSFSGLRTADEASPWAEAEQSVKLFLAPEWEIPAGSRVLVKGRGGQRLYGRSGQPAVYGSHQEIALSLEDEVV